MDQKMLSILANIPDSSTRSKLEPYRDFIHALRQKRKTYREIAQILVAHFGVRVDHTSIFKFIKVRSKARRLQFELHQMQTTVATVPASPLPRASQPSSQPPTPNAPTKPFHFDPSKGLTLSDEALNLKPKKD